jgi:hypothetical protein
MKIEVVIEIPLLDIRTKPAWNVRGGMNVLGGRNLSRHW